MGLPQSSHYRLDAMVFADHFYPIFCDPFNNTLLAEKGGAAA
jgi:hypothetical protein